MNTESVSESKQTMFVAPIDLLTSKSRTKTEYHLDFINEVYPDLPPHELDEYYNNLPVSEPESLNQQDIDYLLSGIPDVNLGYVQYAEYNECVMRQEQIKNKLEETLKSVNMKQERVLKLVRHALPQARYLLWKRYFSTLVSPGTMVGIIAAETFGQLLTQAKLNTFHNAGSANVMAGGFSSFRQILGLSKEYKTPYCRVHLMNKFMTYRDVLDLRKVFVEINVGMLLRETDAYIIGSADEFEYFDWHKDYETVMGISRPDSDIIMRLFFNTTRLYTYRVTLTDIARKIESMSMTICYPGPIGTGIIDVFPDKTVTRRELIMRGFKSTDSSSSMFLYHVVLPELDKMILKGIPKIRAIYPLYHSIWDIVRSSTYAYSSDQINEQTDEKTRELMNRAWTITIDWRTNKYRGVPIERLIHLLNTLNCEVYEASEKELLVVSPDGRDPGILYNEAKTENETKKEELITTGKLKSGQENDFDQLIRYYYLMTNGSNLRDLMLHPFVDPNFTFSNHPEEVSQTFGIEAAKNHIELSINAVVENSGSFVNPRNITLVGDYMAQNSKLGSISYSKKSNRRSSNLAHASHEQAMDVLMKSAAFGDSEQIGSTSAYIYYGKVPYIGTKYADVHGKPTISESYEEELEKTKLEISAHEFSKEMYGTISKDKIFTMLGRQSKPYGDEDDDEYGMEENEDEMLEEESITDDKLGMLIIAEPSGISDASPVISLGNQLPQLVEENILTLKEVKGRPMPEANVETIRETPLPSGHITPIVVPKLPKLVLAREKIVSADPINLNEFLGK